MASIPLNWSQKIWEDLQPAPGRLSSSLRIVLSTVIVLSLLLVLQMPFASLGLFIVFIVGRDSPAISLRSGIFFVIVSVTAVSLEMAVVILTDNDPMARLLSVAIVGFLAGLLVMSTTIPALAPPLGFLYCTVISLWEIHAPADALVKNSLLLIATELLAVGSSIAVEYIFNTRNTADLLQEQRRIRYQSLEAMFSLYAEGVDARRLAEPVLRVVRLAATGQSAMQGLYNTIIERNLNVGALPIGTRVRITMLAQLMDLSAAFATQNVERDNSEVQQQCRRIANTCRSLIPGPIQGDPSPMDGWASERVTLLDRVEQCLQTIVSMPVRTGAIDKNDLVALPSHKVPLIIPGAMKDRGNIAFALKISLCATVCYIIYHAVDWPGISTAVTTVFITGLSTSGAIKQRLIYRLLGSAIGGLILGLGATAFLFPYMDSITALTLLVAAVAFISAWCAGGRRFNYVGLQIAFSFYLVALEGYSAPTELAPARDRLVGIVLALLVMWFVFDRLWPVRTITEMRRTLALLLRNDAKLLRLSETFKEPAEVFERADTLRDQVGKTVASLRTMNDTVAYEFGVDREKHISIGDAILRAGLVAVALFWNQISVLHRPEDRDFLEDNRLIALRHKLAEQLDSSADAIIDKKAIPMSAAPDMTVADERPRYQEYARGALERTAEIQAILSTVSTSL